jgi:hypothetical protein
MKAVPKGLILGVVCHQGFFGDGASKTTTFARLKMGINCISELQRL